MSYMGLFQKIARISVSQASGQDWTETEALWYAKYLESLKSDQPTVDPNGLSTRMLKECSAQINDGTLQQSRLKWENAGMMLRGNFLTQRIGESPRIENAFTPSDIEEIEETLIFSL